MKRRLFLSSIFCAALSIFAATDIKKYWDEPDLSVRWYPILVLPEGITVVYEVKYGAIYTIECIGLWESKEDYLLTFNTGEGRKLSKNNIVSIFYKKKTDKTYTKVKPREFKVE